MALAMKILVSGCRMSDSENAEPTATQEIPALDFDASVQNSGQQYFD